MKLHLPKMLTVALLSACAAISANADVPYTGNVYTWDNTTSGSDPAFGNYALTTYDEQGNPTVTSTVISGKAGNWGNVQAIIASDAIQTGNTMRFDSTHGQNVKTLNYTFTPFTVGGIIVEEGATGFSINSAGSYNRAFFLGNQDGSASYNEIHEDFAINKTTGGLTLTLRGAETMNVASGKTFTLKSNNPIAMSGSLDVTGQGTVDFAQGNVTMANGFTLEVQQGATLKFAGAVTGLSNTIINDGTINFGSTVAVGSFDGFEGTTTYSDGSNGYIISAAYTLIKGAGTDNLTSVSVGTSQYAVNNGVVTIDTPDYTTYHLATDGASVDAGTEQAAHPELANIAFHAATGTVQASQDASVALNLAADTTATLDVDANATLTVTNTLSVSSTQGLVTTGDGTVSVGTLKVNGGTLDIASDLTVTGGGDGKGGNNSQGLHLSGDGATVNINDGTTTVTGAIYTNANDIALNVGTDATDAKLVTRRLEIGDRNGGSATFHIGQHGTVVITGNEDYRQGTSNPQKNTSLQLAEWSQIISINIEGNLYSKDATAFMSNDASSSIAINGGTMAVKGIANSSSTSTRAHTLTMTGGKIVLGERGLAAEPGDWTVTLNSGEIGMYADTVVGRNANIAGAVTFNTAKYEWSDNQTLAAGVEGGTMTVSANLTGEGTITKIGAGTLVLSGANNVLTHTIAANEGSMTLSGGFEIGDIALVGTTVYGDGEHTGNGYATATGSVTVYDGAAKDSVNADAATFTYHGSTVTVTDGVYTLPGTQDTTTYYINGDTDSYRWIDEHKKAELTGGIVVKENATLKADKDMSMSVVAASSKGTVEIADNVVVTAAGGTQTVKLAGDGIYALASGAQTLGSVNVDSFDGYVRLSGNIRDIDLAGNLGSKNVEFKGLSGHFKNLAEGTVDTYSGNIHLENDGDTPAIKITDGYSRTESEYIFAGDISGDGTWELNCGATQHYVFEGSLEDWTGEFKVTKSGGNNNGTSLAFREDAEDVHASITRNGGTLRLIVENDATFHEDVTGITSLKVTEEHSATFEGTTSIGSLIGAGNVTANGDLTLTGTTTTTSVEEGATNFTGTLLLDGDATLTVTGNVDLGGQLQADGDHAITVQGTGSLTLTEGSTIGSVISNSGFVSLTGLTLDGSVFTETEGEDAHFDLAGHMTDDANYFEGTAADYVRVVNGGTSTGSGLVWRDKDDYVLTADGKIITGVEDIDYGTFYVGGEISTSDINGSTHVSEIANINVGDGATLTVDQSTDLAITVTGEATVTGDALEVTEIGIANEATASFGDKLEMVDDGVEFRAAEGESVSVYNGGETAAYDLTNQDLVVTAQSIVKTTGEDVTVSNWLTVEEITNVQGGKLTLDGMEDAVVVANITVGPDSAVELLDNQTSEEITVTVTEELAAGNGTLLANLVMADDSALLVNGQEKALHVGSELTMRSNIALDGTTLRKLDDLAVGDYFWLIDAAAGRELSYTGPTGEDAWYDSVFSRTAAGGDYELEGDFNIVFSETDGFGLQKFSDTPEPTTGTLSLLALAALAARRRRK